MPKAPTIPRPEPFDEQLVRHILETHQSFLPGENPPDEGELRSNLTGSILLAGLSQSEAQFVLSTLPAGVSQVYFAALDKGLSNSKVFSGQYQLGANGLSRPFVFKIGPANKIRQEFKAVESLVCPHIQGVNRPIARVVGEAGIIVQDLVGLGANSTLKSLKECVRTKHGAAIVSRLLKERLGKWYYDGLNAVSDHSLGQLFAWYLTKVESGPDFPQAWDELKLWTGTISGLAWHDAEPVIEHLKASSVRSPTCIVHGDLHSQNVIVDDKRETWPIDFAWCHDRSSPLLDLTMLECSLKFLGFPQRSDLHTLIKLEHELLKRRSPSPSLGRVPYQTEINNVLKAVRAIRDFAMGDMGISFKDYRKALVLMTYCHATHPKLNRPLVLSSLQMGCALERGTVTI